MKVFATLILIMAVWVSACSGQQVLFSDDFDSGLDDQWIIPNGGWVIEDGRLQNTSTCGFQQCMPDIWSGSESQSDYMITFDLELLEPSPSSHGMSLYLQLMLSESCEPLVCPDGMPFGYSIDVGYEQGGNIQRLDGSYPQEYIHTAPNGNELLRWVPNTLYHVKYGRLGGDIVFTKWADGEAESGILMIATDDTYHSGFWGLSIWNGMVAIDNFEVTGYGVVSNGDMTWGGVKSMYR